MLRFEQVAALSSCNVLSALTSRIEVLSYINQNCYRVGEMEILFLSSEVNKVQENCKSK